MIRFLQTPGPVKKIILSGILLVFCGAMVITLIPGGLGSDFLTGRPGQGVIATVAGEPVTTIEVNREARQMLRQQFPQGSAQASMLLPFFASRAAEQVISRKAMIAEAQRLVLKSATTKCAMSFRTAGTPRPSSRAESLSVKRNTNKCSRALI
jgi:hypothetical protein